MDGFFKLKIGENMIESKKYPIVTPIMACIFIIVQRVLFSGTAIPQYDQNGTRFYLYSVALGLVAVGGNLLALYMGTTEKNQ